MRTCSVCWKLLACLALLTPLVQAGEIDLGLREVLDAAAPSQVLSTLIYLNAQVDLDRLNASLQATRAPARLRHEAVVRALQTTAELSRGGVEEYLQHLQDISQIERCESVWIVNAFRVDATPAIIEQIARHPDVATVYYNYRIENVKPAAMQRNKSRGDGSRTPEIGLQVIHVPEVWALGYHGEGMLISSLDTGVDGDHPALHDRWRGLDPRYMGHPEWAFFDPVTHWTYPHDSGTHGTHTMGTACGGVPGDQIGVAPGAEWIHAAVIDRVDLHQTVMDAMSAFQWLIDPDEDPSTSFDVPQINSNSWGLATYLNIPPFSTPCDASFWPFIDACETAGIVVLFSAGGDGPSPNSLRRPADRATDDYRNCAVGAVDPHYPALPVAYFSSRGPTNCTPNGQPFIKPNISAPGVDIRSSVPGGGYDIWSGGAMTTPHVAGVVALMRQACPDLTVDQIKRAIYDTAMDKGPVGKDNDYGWGVVDALAAVQRALNLCASSTGTIELDQPVYRCEDTVQITVIDIDLNTNPTVIEAVDVAITSTTEPTGETVTLSEANPDSAHFVGTIPISATNAPGVLASTDGDVIAATYIDADNGQGGYNVPVVATATVDCSTPVISSVTATNIAAHAATVTFNTDEESRGTVHYGFACDNLDHTTTASTFSTTPTIDLAGLQSGARYYFMVEAEDHAGNMASDPNCYSFVTLDATDYFTELFDAAPFDLAHQRLEFTPVGGLSYYAACAVAPIAVLPTDPAGGTVLTFTGGNDDGYALLTLGGGAQVGLYGTPYTQFYVGTNGYITFGSSDTTYTESLSSHFNKLRIAPLFDDLNVTGAGQVSWKQLADHVAVTWLTVPEFSSTGANTFQIELFFDGRITISYLDISALDGLAGLSRGQGLPSDFVENDLSGLGSCQAEPLHISQINWLNMGGQLPDSRCGYLAIDFHEVQAHTGLASGYVNVYTYPAGWTIRDLPFDVSWPWAGWGTMFDLGVDGDVSWIRLCVSYTANPLVDFVCSPTTWLPVAALTRNAEGRNGPLPPLTLPVPASLIVFDPLGPTYGFFQSIRLSVETDNGQCGPAAVANSLQWLENEDGIPVPHDNVPGIDGNPPNSLVGRLDQWMGRGQGDTVTDGEFMQGKLSYIGESNLRNRLICKHWGGTFVAGDVTHNGVRSTDQSGGTQTLAQWIAQEVAAGEDVELALGGGAGGVGHWTNVVAAGEILGVPWIVGVDDGQQCNNAAGTGYLDGGVTWSPIVNGLALGYSMTTDFAVSESPRATGDMDGDGDVDFDDINGFVLALANPLLFELLYPNIDVFNADINGDGVIDFADINPFVECLSSGECP